MTQPVTPAGSPLAASGALDSHCHLADEMFTVDVGEVVARARGTGAPTALCILDAGSEPELIRAHGVHEMWPAIRFAIGVHPQNADAYRADFNLAAVAVENALTRVPRVCAIGEMGLDYHYDFAPKGLQQQVFRAQVKLARKHRLPIVVHTREADQDTVRILKDAGQGEVKGVFHCFTGDVALAAAALELGFYLSFSGIVSFPNSSALRGVAAKVPEDRFLIETDSPYLAPVPHRGKRNEPGFVIHVAEALAVARRTTPDAIVQRSAANFAALFGAW
jgi:TatD DNase family protein